MNARCPDPSLLQWAGVTLWKKKEATCEMGMTTLTELSQRHQGWPSLPRERILAMDWAKDGFSATMSTVFILVFKLAPVSGKWR